MRQHQLFGFWIHPLWLFSVLLVVTLKVSAQNEQASQPVPAPVPETETETETEQNPTELSQAKEIAGEATAKAATKKQQEPAAATGQTGEPVRVEDIKDGVSDASMGAQSLQPIDVRDLKRVTLGKNPDPTPKAKAKKDIPTLEILGTQVAPGESHRLLWVAGETTYGSKLETPVYVIRGKHTGPTLCLTAAIHGDELNGVEIIRKLVSELSPKKLYGTVIGVPIVNLLGFTRGTRYLPDRRDLNRYFPGNPDGSSASRIAASFFEHIVRHCDLLIDLHTGSLTRTNMPQVRANLQIPEVLELTTKFGSTAVLHSSKLRGNLRSAATNYGIPAVALELGEPGSLQPEHVDEGVEIIEKVLSGLDMTRRLWTVGGSQPVFYSSRWVRVNTGGLLISQVEVGERVWEGAVLGSMVNPITNESFDVISPYSGRVLGMALNQFMLPGYAAFNIGIVADEQEAIDNAQNFECIGTDMEAGRASEEFGCTIEEGEELEQEDVELGVMEVEEGS